MESIQQQLEPPMDAIVKQYERIIDKIYQTSMKSANYEKQTQKTIKDVYENLGVQLIAKANNNLKIIMDNDFGKAIIRKANDNIKKYMNDFKKLEGTIAFLTYLAKIVDIKKFITKREATKVDSTIKQIKSKKEFRINQRIKVLQNSDSKQQFRQDFFSALGIQSSDGQDIQNLDQQAINQLYRTFYRESLKDFDRKLFIKIDSIISKFEDKKQILGAQLANKVDQYFGQQIGKDDIQLQINKKLIQLAEKQSLQSNQQHLQALQEQFQEIKKILNKFSGMRLFNQNLKLQLKLAKFGSIISGFATRNTDMDLTILTNCYINEIEFLQFLQAFLKAQFKQKKNIQCEIKFIKQARIPLLKLTVKSNKITTSIDLIVNNILGVINSKFLSVYGSVKWVKQLGLLVKLWAKNQELVRQQLFSSYSFNLLLLHFLIQTRRINLIMDARNRNAEKTPHFKYKRIVRDQLQQFPVYFQFKNSSTQVTSLKRANIYQILVQFFEYYSGEGKHWKFQNSEQIITIDGSKNKQFDENYMFTIRDPFDQKHNPGRVSSTQKQRIINCFNRACETLKLKNLEDVVNIFEVNDR